MIVRMTRPRSVRLAPAAQPFVLIRKPNCPLANHRARTLFLAIFFIDKINSFCYFRILSDIRFYVFPASRCLLVPGRVLRTLAQGPDNVQGHFYWNKFDNIYIVW